MAVDRRHAPFWLLTVALGAAFLLPTLLSEGTFLDGEIYACLSRNLAAGEGSFWAPHFSATSQDRWFDHPPLGVALGALPFLVLGDHLWVEHLYALLITLAGGALLVAAWRSLFASRPEIRALGWLPLLMWLLNPQVTWAHANNMLEGTMSLFTFAAVWLAVSGALAPRHGWLRLLAAPVFIVLAVLTKDVVGLFPLATVPALAVANRQLSRRRALALTLGQVAAVALLLGLLLLWPAARENLTQFARTQLLPSLAGRRGDTGNRFLYLVKLLNTLLPSLALAVLLLRPWRWRRGALPSGPWPRRACGLLVLALAGSLPLVFSARQSLFYVLPSFPFFALALAVLVAPGLGAGIAAWPADSRRLRTGTLVATAVLLAVVGWSLSRVGTVNRDRTMRADVKLLVEHLGPDSAGAAAPVRTVAACRSLWDAWGLEAALVRRGRVALQRGDVGVDWLIAPAECDEPPLAAWERVPLATVQFHLYQRRRV